MIIAIRAVEDSIFFDSQSPPTSPATSTAAIPIQVGAANYGQEP